MTKTKRAPQDLTDYALRGIRNDLDGHSDQITLLLEDVRQLTLRVQALEPPPVALPVVDPDPQP